MAEQDANLNGIMETVAGLMALAARTAPKAKGKDFLEIKVLQGESLNKLADSMVEYGEKMGGNKSFFARDGENVRRSDAVLLLALNNCRPARLNCGACGFAECSELPQKKDGPEFSGPVCAWRLMDLGIALGSAAKTASLLNADNRMMYTIGAVARTQQLIAGEIVVGIPISATGKNIYFDR